MAIEGGDIAIIGSGCRFPGGSTSPDKLWELLSEPRLVASEVPSLKGYYHKNAQYHGHANVREAYLLEGEGVHRRFDAGFFGISPSEANNVDPQTRLLLEVVYEALESGGQTIDKLKGSDTAVYAGQMVNDYELLMYRDHENYGKYHATGASRAMMSNRISYFFDWHGPSMTIDTACSSSLVALHHAVQQLRSGHSRVAIVAGSNLIYDAGTFIAETNLQMLSPGGRSRMWDADADGYARGEGVAAIVLKTRQAAEADGDHIECIIRETALNQDGRTRGQTMPSAAAQAQLIKDCYARAGLDLSNPVDRPQYFEAHGTGTPAGDPIEAEAVASALFPDGRGGVDESFRPLFVGSCKTVIGHTEGTAGIAGILKASLALQHARIPPNLHFNRLNPDVRPFYDNLCIPTGAEKPWPSMAWQGPRRASVNSFGFGGTNAHAILESYTPRADPIPSDHVNVPPCIPFVFSAASESSLKQYLESFCDYLSRGDSVSSLHEIASSLAARRTRFPVAVAIGACTRYELQRKIQQKLEASRSDPELRVGFRTTRRDAAAGASKPRVLGVFTGQGAQWAQMGLELITTFPASKNIMERLQRRLDQLPVADRPAWSLLQELQKDASSTRVMSAAISQPLCTAIQIIQVDLLRAAGIEFSVVVGHSSGEIAAAYAAGLLSAEDAICIAYYRGLHSGSSHGAAQRGAMMAVGTSAKDAEDLLGFPEFEGRACVAAVNSKQSVTLSGDQDALREMEVVFGDEEKFTRFLKVDRAYHSHHMKACSSEYLDSLEALGVEICRGNQTRWFSSVSGSELGEDDLLRGPYWENNMAQPVLFMQAIDQACIAMKQLNLVVELGPHPALKGPALETIQDRLSCTVPYTGLFHRGVSSIVSLADGLGYAWTHLGEGGVDLQSYGEFISGRSNSGPVKGLPTYAWDHQSEYWHESRWGGAVRLRQDPVNELLGHLTPDSTEHDMRWRHMLRLSEIPWLSGHRLQNGIIFPAAGYVVSVLEAAQMLCKKSPIKTIELVDLDIVSALMFEHENSSMEIILSLTNISRRKERVIEAEFKYHAAAADGSDDLKLKASGRVRVHLGEPDDAALPARRPSLSNMLPVSKEKFYESIAEIGYQYGGLFKALEGIQRKLGAATGSISTLESSSLMIHPAALDAAFLAWGLADPSVELAVESSTSPAGLVEAATFTTCLARTIQQIVHRYPRMHILELSSETGAATKTILDDIGSKFASYTVATHASALTTSESELAWLNDKRLISKNLDFSCDLKEQGFVDSSYDLVVAPDSFPGVSDLDQALRKVRRLLKPGGHLVVLSPLPHPNSSFGDVSVAVPEMTPALRPNLKDWDDLLRTTGFSGIDTSNRDVEAAIPLSVFVSQAVDEKIAFLRNPLSLALPSSERLVQDLVILGGNSLATGDLTKQVSAALKVFCSRIQTADSLHDFVNLRITPGTVILNLQDLDGSVFEHLDDKTWKALKRMTLHTGTLIWVTRGRRAENPRANMATGLLRAAARENPALDYVLLEIEEASDSDHRIIAETLLRHKAASRWCHQDDLLFTAENELVVDKAGRLLVPRLMPSQEMNDRYNSSGREVRTPVRADTHEVGLSMRDAKWDVSLIPPSSQPQDGRLRLQTTHSLISPVRVAEFGSMFVVLGRDTTSSRDVVALSSNNASFVHVHPKLVIPVGEYRRSEDRVLWLTANHLLASIILRGLSEGDKVLVHGWQRESVWILAERARILGVEAKFTTTDHESSEADGFKRIVLHPNVSASALDQLAQEDFSVFVDMTNPAETETIGSLISSSLSTYCRKENYASLFAKHAYNPRESHLEGIHARLDEAMKWASAVMAQPGEAVCTQDAIPAIPLASVPGEHSAVEPLTVVDWASTSAVSARAFPVDSMVSFPDNRTYWLVGLTGGVGLSLCEWMVQRGARSFVISSRSPNIEAAWLDEMRAKGVVVKVSECDVTNESQVRALYQEVSSSMPPIAGVAQGVMVLEDTSLQDMTLDQLLAVTKPKVEGSIYLDRLFSDNVLDFFIFFSSVSTVVGNHGQANYAAANAFMASLAEQRRARGVAASVIDIGPIAGIGYISRSFEDGALDRMTMRTSGWAKTSERDFHQLFGEAVLAGRPGSTGPIEIGSGLRRVHQGEDDQPVWHSWPRMSHLISGGEGFVDPAQGGAEARVPIKDRLSKAPDGEVYNIIWDAFTTQLESHFQLDTRDASKEELATMRLDQMGIDSLTAMEIRGWFMKTLEVNIPVLKILNGSSIGELVAVATDAIQERRAQTVDEGSDASATSQELADSSSTDPDEPGDTDDENGASRPGSLRDFAQSGQTIVKSVPVSFTQARFYPSGIFLEDLVGLNHTAWGKITGAIDPERLRQAVLAVGQQHEILRTAFFDQDGQQMQHILKTSNLHLEHQQTEDEEKVERIAMTIQKGHVYDVARGETIRLILMSRPGGENYLVIGVHPLIMDATGIQVFLRWLAFHYTNPNSQPRVKQFATASQQRHAALAAGAFRPELEYWRREFPSPPPALPLLTVSKVRERPVLRAYENITADCRIGPDTKARIAGICRQLRTTPFHFYLAALRALLLRYCDGGGEDVTTAVAENGRGRDAEEMEVIGPLYNLVLVRIVADLSTRFRDLLEVARDKTYAGLANGNMPFIKVVEELGLQRNAKHTPFFQVFADYRTGQRETVAFGEENELRFMGFDLNVPYDVYLDTVDVPDGDCAHCLFLRKDLFDQPAAERLASSYKRLIEAFAAEPESSVGMVDLAAPEETEEAGLGT
ncbi:putative PKS/NRPS-like protein biosynthetic cluster [Diaporthe eres]